MQKRAARIITSSNYEIRTKDIFKSLKWIPIEFTLQKELSENSNSLSLFPTFMYFLFNFT